MYTIKCKEFSLILFITSEKNNQYRILFINNNNKEKNKLS